MEHVEVQGEKIPALGFGTWKLEGREAREAVKDALDLGYRHVDTAQAYGNEREVGRGIRKSGVDRDDIWLTTKVWRDNLEPGSLIPSVRESLDRLEVDAVDLLLVHWPFPGMDWEAVFRELEEAVEKGFAHNIGVSNFTTRQIEKAQRVCGTELLTNQVEYHPFLDQDAVLEACRSNDMMLTAYSPVARGDVVGNDTLQEIGERHGKTEAQVALRWLVQQEKVSAIPKAASREHRRDNLDVFDFSLTGEEMQEIKELTSRNDRKVNPGFAPDWD